MSETTVIGSPGSTVTIPYTSADSYAFGQAANILTDVLNNATVPGNTVTAYTNGQTVSTGGAIVAEGTSVDIVGTLLNSDTLFAAVNSGSGTNTIAAIGGTAQMTVISSGNTDLVFVNNSPSTTAYLGGGQNYFKENSSTAGADIYVAGAGTTAAQDSIYGGAIIDASQGNTTINLGNTSFTDVLTGGNVSIVANAGTETAEISGSSTVPVSISGTTGSTLDLLNNASAFITPGAGNIIIIPGSTGSATLFGGSATIGGVAVSAPAFTGSATVFGGLGYYQGGSGGSNILMSGTVAGATTLIGGADTSGGDTLISYAGNNYLLGGTGNDILWDAATVAGGGDTLIGAGGSDTLLGAQDGGNTIGFGSDTTFAYGYFNGSSTSALSNTYYQAGADGFDVISGFRSGVDQFNLSLGAGSVGGLTVSTLTSVSAGTVAKLSDGTEIFFAGSTVVASDFKTV
ncbi:MAG: hypothetical protein P4K98_06225 [Bryobacteraceae bacterium]|nr:hypothetical protein [Bryobacteraceae bacterium]